MFQAKKIFVMLLIATFLVAIPLSLINTEPEITVVVNTLEIDADYARPPGAGVKPDKTGGGKPGDYLLTGYKWDLYLPDDGLTLKVGGGLDVSVISASAEEWDTNTAEDLVSSVTDGANGVFDEISGNPDYNNELIYADPQSFADAGLDPNRVIAVCYTWHTQNGEIRQFDIAFNAAFDWGNADSDNDGIVDNPNKMDVQNIATHEIGHGFGLGDIYKRKLSYLTMYGYSGEGDIQKRTLAQGDLDGIQALYGVPSASP